MCAQIICAHWTPGLDSPQATLEQTPFCKHQKYQRETPDVPKRNTGSTKGKHQKYQRETPGTKYQESNRRKIKHAAPLFDPHHPHLN